MANIHLKEAAKNLRSAIVDVDQQLHAAQVDCDRQVQTMQKQINSLNAESRQLTVLSMKTDSEQEKARLISHVQDNERQVSELNRKIFHTKDELRTVQAELEKQKTSYSEISTMLDAAS